jgi:hypothetical protein
VLAPGSALMRNSFKTTGPQVFRIGDIIEVQLSFIVVALKGKGKKMLTTLHSMALLNGVYAKVSTMLNRGGNGGPYRV